MDMDTDAKYYDTDSDSIDSDDIDFDDLQYSLDWIDEYKNEEKKYELFYKEPIENLKLNFVYVGNNNEIECINESSILLSDGVLNKERLLEIITINKIKNNIRYGLKYLLKYNFTLEPSNIISYLNSKCRENYLIEIKMIEDITFSNAISVMHDLNCLLFIFIETPRNSNTKSTDKIQHKYRTTKKLMEQLRLGKTKTRRINN